MGKPIRCNPGYYGGTKMNICLNCGNEFESKDRNAEEFENFCCQICENEFEEKTKLPSIMTF